MILFNFPRSGEETDKVNPHFASSRRCSLMPCFCQNVIIPPVRRPGSFCLAHPLRNQTLLFFFIFIFTLFYFTPMVDSCQCIAKPIQYCKANPSLNYGIWLSHRENILKSLSSSDIQAAKDFTVVAKSCIIPTLLKSHQCFLSSGATWNHQKG